MAENSFFNFDSPVVRIDEKSYNKAIDEFARRLKYENSQTMSTTVKYSFEEFVDKIAEQLKGGAE